MICKIGKIKLAALEKPPLEIFANLTDKTSDSKHFLQNVWPYHACFQITYFELHSNLRTMVKSLLQKSAKILSNLLEYI